MRGPVRVGRQRGNYQEKKSLRIFPVDTSARQVGGWESGEWRDRVAHVPAQMFDTKASRTNAFAGLIAERATPPFALRPGSPGDLIVTSFLGLPASRLLVLVPLPLIFLELETAPRRSTLRRCTITSFDERVHTRQVSLEFIFVPPCGHPGCTVDALPHGLFCKLRFMHSRSIEDEYVFV